MRSHHLIDWAPPLSAQPIAVEPPRFSGDRSSGGLRDRADLVVMAFSRYLSNSRRPIVISALYSTGKCTLPSIQRSMLTATRNVIRANISYVKLAQYHLLKFGSDCPAAAASRRLRALCLARSRLLAVIVRPRTNVATGQMVQRGSTPRPAKVPATAKVIATPPVLRAVRYRLVVSAISRDRFSCSDAFSSSVTVVGV